MSGVHSSASSNNLNEVSQNSNDQNNSWFGKKIANYMTKKKEEWTSYTKDVVWNTVTSGSFWGSLALGGALELTVKNPPISAVTTGLAYLGLRSFSKIEQGSKFNAIGDALQVGAVGLVASVVLQKVAGPISGALLSEHSQKEAATLLIPAVGIGLAMGYIAYRKLSFANWFNVQGAAILEAAKESKELSQQTRNLIEEERKERKAGEKRQQEYTDSQIGTSNENTKNKFNEVDKDLNANNLATQEVRSISQETNQQVDRVEKALVGLVEEVTNNNNKTNNALKFVRKQMNTGNYSYSSVHGFRPHFTPINFFPNNIGNLFENNQTNFDQQPCNRKIN